jgi:hypothetical protein
MMVSNGGQQAYGNPVWGAGPGMFPQWRGEEFWRHLVNSRAFWIGVMILGFIAWWPIGLALLFFMLGSGRMGCGMHRRRHGGGRGGWQRWGGPWGGCGGEEAAEEQASVSGNRAFDEYRAETLRRLEEEQREFASFLDRLRFAKDKAEFDEFMASRRRPPAPPEPPPAA